MDPHDPCKEKAWHGKNLSVARIESGTVDTQSSTSIFTCVLFNELIPSQYQIPFFIFHEPLLIH